MALLAICMPILPGKKDKWLKMMEELHKEPMKSNFINPERMPASMKELFYKRHQMVIL